MRTTFLAVDIGAGSGRVCAVSFKDSSVTLEDIHRFGNEPREEGGFLRWDIEALYSSVRTGIKKACAAMNPAGIGIDTWGVDYVLLGEDDMPLEAPVCYRDNRTDGVMERFFERLPREDIYQATGIQFMQFNTLYQLHAQRLQNPDLLDKASTFLMMPDYLSFRFTGIKGNEYTNATTTQMIEAKTRGWCPNLLQALGLNPGLFPPLRKAGDRLGVAAVCGCPDLSFVLSGTHDTASAVAAVPASGNDWAYICSGTWCLMGIETDAPVITDASRRYNFTNEGGVFGTIRLLKNVMGLWIVRRVKEELAPAAAWEELLNQADSAPAFAHVLDVNCQSFFAPESMVGAINDFCSRTGQRVPKSVSAYLRAAEEGLALSFRQILGELLEVSGREITTIHLVGGGAQDSLLCRMTASSTGLPVFAGPVEATAIGNAVVQAVTAGEFSNHYQARQALRNATVRYDPSDHVEWDDVWKRYQQVKECEI